MDREKVIGHLNDCMEASRADNGWVFVRKDIIADALALLKEQDETELCGRCGRVRLKSKWESR